LSTAPSTALSTAAPRHTAHGSSPGSKGRPPPVANTGGGRLRSTAFASTSPTASPVCVSYRHPGG
jgi:hypothetical protein